MESEKKTNSDMEKNESSVKLLEKLQDQIHSIDASSRRRAAFNLSWLQEDGFEILKGALYGNYPATTKNAAAYGLRKMRGRMKKMALEVLRDGLKKRDKTTKEICRNALQLLGQKVPDEPGSKDRSRPKTRIREIPVRRGIRKTPMRRTN
jgi:hypothetical protein